MLQSLLRTTLGGNLSKGWQYVFLFFIILGGGAVANVRVAARALAPLARVWFLRPGALIAGCWRGLRLRFF